MFVTFLNNFDDFFINIILYEISDVLLENQIKIMFSCKKCSPYFDFYFINTQYSWFNFNVFFSCV